MDNTSAFCSLCGLLIGNHDGSPVSDEALHWDMEVRAIRTRAYVHDPFVTGVGWLNSYDEICADPREDIGYTNTDVSLEAHELRYTSQQYWCFPVHAACWDLLRCCLDPENRLGASNVARHLFALLYNTPTDGQGILLSRHEYGGAARFQAHHRPDRALQIRNSQSYFYLQHNPIDGFDFDFTPALASDPVPNFSTLNILDSGNGDIVDVFGSLPGEILFMILEHLPSTSVCDLRLASRPVAMVSRTPLLPQSFWSSRFENNHEMAFVFANNTRSLTSGPVDWRQLYINAKAMLQNPRAYPSFQNRFRIWQALGSVIPSLALRVSNEKHIAKAPYSGVNPRLDGFTSRGMAASELTYEHSSTMIRNNSATTELDAGCRLFEKQSLPWPNVSSTEIVRLAASLVQYDGRTYISGLRILSEGDSLGEIEYARAGYINRLTEQTVSLDPNDVVQTFTINLTIEGIIGIRIDMTGPNGPYSHSMGNLDVIGAESGIAKLSLQGRLDRHCFLVGMDASRLVSIQLLEETPDLPTGNKNEPVPTGDGVAVEIWNPVAPGHQPDWKSPVAFPRQTFNMCLNMDFGGADGELLASLTMINFFMGEFPAVFHGISFTYGDGTERFYGNKSYRLRTARTYNCIVQSFPLAGAKGEMINKVETSYCKSTDSIQSILLSTNAGRSTTFHLHGEMPHLKDQPSNTVIKPSPGNLLIAFCAKLKSPGGQIRDFTARFSATRPVSMFNDVVLPQTSSHQVPITPLVLKSAQEMLAYQGGFAFTSATLAGLRAIHLSTGANGFSRGTHHISGLRFVYGDSDLPVVLGQWIAEVARLELEPDERLTEITTWHDFTNRFARVKFGPTIGIKFATSKGVVKEFLQQHVEDKVRLQYRENPYENLSSMIWGCNYQWDHVRVVYKPKSQETKMALLCSFMTHRAPEWTVREKVFVDDMNPDGSPDSVSAIAVSFKHLSNEPSGLSFIYQSGKKQTLGYWGEKPQVEALQENEKLIRLEIGISQGHKMGRITFETDQNRRLVFTHPTNREGGRSSIQNTEVHWLRRVPGVSPAKGTKYTFEVPEAAGDFVGIWAIPKRQDHCLRYPFGPIFETQVVEN